VFDQFVNAMAIDRLLTNNGLSFCDYKKNINNVLVRRSTKYHVEMHAVKVSDPLQVQIYVQCNDISTFKKQNIKEKNLVVNTLSSSSIYIMQGLTCFQQPYKQRHVKENCRGLRLGLGAVRVGHPAEVAGAAGGRRGLPAWLGDWRCSSGATGMRSSGWRIRSCAGHARWDGDASGCSIFFLSVYRISISPSPCMVLSSCVKP
jgi:hypothetical protein